MLYHPDSYRESYFRLYFWSNQLTINFPDFGSFISVLYYVSVRPGTCNFNQDYMWPLPFWSQVRYFKWWGEKDSNLRSRKTTDLQSVPFGHSGTSPFRCGLNHEFLMSRWRDSNPRPTDYKSVALANWATSALLINYIDTQRTPQNLGLQMYETYFYLQVVKKKYFSTGILQVL